LQWNQCLSYKNEQNKMNGFALYSRKHNPEIMTYKEILNTLANKTVETYDLYLQSKIAGLIENDGSIADQTELHRSEYDRLEKKLIAMLATVKNDESINEEVPEGFYEDFIK